MNRFGRILCLSMILGTLVFSAPHSHGQIWRDSLDRTFDAENGKSMPYRLFVPPGHDIPGAKYPIVLFLHRGAFVGDDNRLQVSDHISGLIRATQGEEYPAFLLAPQTLEPWWYESVHELPMQIVNAIEQEYQVDSDRIYVVGTSMGGFGTPDIVSRNPNRFAAAVPMSAGLFADPESFDYGDLLPEEFPVVDAEVMADVPFWVFHGENDGVIPAQWSRDLVATLDSADGEVRYTELPGSASHSGIWTRILRDRDDELYPWLFSKSRSELSLPGDLNRNRVLDLGDINLLTKHVLDSHDVDSRFDLNQDGTLDSADRNHWVTTIRGTYLGDSNLDGEFNTTDLVQVFQNGHYEDGVERNSRWEEGDWNGDGDFDTSDLVLAFQDGGYELGPRTKSMIVPEPANTVVICLVGMFGLISRKSFARQ